MTNIYPSLPRISVKDSFDDDELTDIDDEVFIRDGKTGTGLKINDDSGVKRPLMAPRKKLKPSHFENQQLPLKTLLLPVCYGIMALVILLGLILLCIVTVNIFPAPLTVIKKLFPGKEMFGVNNSEALPCTSLTTNIVWVKTLPKFTSEAPLRSLDVNGDNIEDIIVGFSTGLDALDAPSYLCDLYFDGQNPCLGGIRALDGKSGDTLWTHWTDHAIFSIDCALDVNNDKIKDCIVTGRGGILHVIDGSDGSIIWKISSKEYPAISDEEVLLNVYDARYISDINSDSVGDVIVSHTTQAGRLRSSEIIILSGKNGDLIKTIEFSENEQLFIAPQTLIHPDGEVIYLLSSSTPEQLGGVYTIPQTNLLYGKLDLKTLQHGKGKGVLLTPILVDITLDGTADIIVSSLDSKIRAYNGLTFELIWNYTVPESEVISIPIPGYYNDDDIPDIMVKHQIGPGFPVYYYSQSTILDGKTGEPLLEQPIKDSGNGQMSGLSLSVDGTGNDWFLYWSANCLNNNNIEQKYRFLKGQSLLSQSRANLCKLRFNTTLSTQFMAMSQHIGPPGQSLYFSDDWKLVELNNSVDVREQSEDYFNSNNNNDDEPSKMEINNAMENGPMVAQRSAKDKNYQMNYHAEEIPTNEQIDYMITNKNVDADKKEADGDRFAVYNDLTDFKEKDPNIFPREMSDWSHSNDWNDIPYSESDDDLEASQQNSEQIPRNRFIDSSISRRKRTTTRKNNNSNNNNNRKSKKYKNINEPFDKSIQRQSTGLILPSLTNANSAKVSVDLVFSVYWLPPSDVSLVLLQQDLECIKMKEDKATIASRKLEAYEREFIIAECLANRGINYQWYKEGLDRENVKFSFGQMTIYRMKLECACPDDLLPGQSCKNISHHQRWPAHLGQMADGYFKPFLKYK